MTPPIARPTQHRARGEHCTAQVTNPLGRAEGRGAAATGQTMRSTFQHWPRDTHMAGCRFAPGTAKQPDQSSRAVQQDGRPREGRTLIATGGNYPWQVKYRNPTKRRWIDGNLEAFKGRQTGDVEISRWLTRPLREKGRACRLHASVDDAIHISVRIHKVTVLHPLDVRNGWSGDGQLLEHDTSKAAIGAGSVRFRSPRDWQVRPCPSHPFT